MRHLEKTKRVFMESVNEILHQNIPVLIYDLSVPLEKRVPREFPTISAASRYLGVSVKRIRTAADPLKKLRLFSPMLNKEITVRFKKLK